MLQTRNAKRPAQAAVRFARDAVDEGLLDREQALMTDRRRHAHRAARRRPSTPRPTTRCIATGVGAAPGGAKGEVVFTAQEAVEAAAEGRDVVLVRPDTNANDVAGFHAAKGILTSLGGKASHAALVARGMGVPCVTAASELQDRPRAARHPRRRPRDRGRRLHRHQRHHRRGHARRRPARRPHARTRPSTRSSRPSRPCSAGRTTSAGSACAPTPTRRTTRRRRASWARRASACAAPSTCSWPRTASRRCAR